MTKKSLQKSNFDGERRVTFGQNYETGLLNWTFDTQIF